jgi:hypothetical protein
VTSDIALQAATEGITPVEYMLSVMRNPEADETRRIDCAKALAPFMHARLSPVEDKAHKDDSVPLPERIAEYNREEAIETSAGKVVELKR